MDLTLFHAIWTTVMFVLFVAIWVWAFSARRKASFADAARLPLEDDETAATATAQRD